MILPQCSEYIKSHLNKLMLCELHLNFKNAIKQNKHPGKEMERGSESESCRGQGRMVELDRIRR
jgi:hypothetical protein